MGLVSYLKQLFSKNKNVSIINIGDLLSIPGRSYFKDNKDMLNLIDKYKEYYLNILSVKRKVISKEISDSKLENKIKMYIKLILNILMNDDDYDFESLELLDQKIGLLKLKMYLKELEKLENEVISKLIALNELENNRKIPKINRETIKNEIDNLTATLYVFLSQKTAVRNEIDTFLTHISISDAEILIKNVNDRTTIVLNDAKYLLNVYEFVSEKELQSIYMRDRLAIIALLEMKIEEYIYNNKFDSDKYNLLIDNLVKIIDLDYEEAKAKKDELIIEIGNFERIYKLYYKYGRNEVSEDDFYHLYSACFKILTFDLLEDTFNKDDTFAALEICDSDTIEYKIYGRILFEKKQQILLGQNEVINHLFGNSSRKIIKLLSEYFKDDSKRFEFYGTPTFHHSDDAIRIILALDSMKNLNRLLNSKINRANLPVDSCFDELFIDDLLIVKKDSLINDNHSKQFTFALEIPLSTVLEVMDVTKEVPSFYKCLYEIYERINEKDSNNFIYYLPEGIVEIDARRQPYSYYAEKVREEAKGKIIYMPSSLEKIEDNMFRFTDLSDIRLNEGIKSIGWYSLSSRKNDIAVFDVPSTLECCDGTSVNLTGSDYLRFNNYKESKLLYSPEQLGNLIKKELTGKVLNFIYNGKDRIDADVEVITKTLSKIILIEDDHVFKIIRIDDIKCYGKVTDMRTKELEYPVSNEIAQRYAKKIIKKIEYEIRKTENENKKVKRKSK